MTTTRELVEGYYAHANRADWDAWLSLFSDDVVGDEQLPGHFEGIGFLKGVVQGISTGYSRFNMYPQKIVVDGDTACVIWRCDAANAAGVPIGYPDDPDRPVLGANLFQVADSRIVYIRTVHDTVPFAPFTSQGR